MKKIALLAGMLVVILVLASCAGQSPEIVLGADAFEFGEVVNGVIAKKDLTITNNGGAPLIIEEVSTSCGCTTAEVYPLEIAPGDSGILHIEFDSGAHGPDMTGELMRQIFFRTNDPDQPEVYITFTANVVK